MVAANRGRLSSTMRFHLYGRSAAQATLHCTHPPAQNILTLFMGNAVKPRPPPPPLSKYARPCVFPLRGYSPFRARLACMGSHLRARLGSPTLPKCAACCVFASRVSWAGRAREGGVEVSEWWDERLEGCGSYLFVVTVYGLHRGASARAHDLAHFRADGFFSCRTYFGRGG